MPLDAHRALPPRPAALRRAGTIAARSWRSKLYVPIAEADALRPEDIAAAERAFSAAVAGDPAGAPSGFALLRRGSAPGSLELVCHWWEDTVLSRTALMLPRHGGPPRRTPRIAGEVGCVDELLLMAREAAAWRRLVLEADPPAPDEYLAECCA